MNFAMIDVKSSDRSGQPPCHPKSKTFLIQTFSRYHGNIAYPFGAEDSTVAGDLLGSTQGFGIVVGELYGGLAFDSGHFADQADGVEIGAAGGIAASEIIGQQ